MYTKTFTVPVPIFADTDLSYRHRQLTSALTSVLDKEFTWDYAVVIPPLRGSGTYQIGDQAYVEATVIVQSIQDPGSSTLPHRLNKAADALP